MIYELHAARLSKAPAPFGDGQALPLDEIEEIADHSRQTLEHLRNRIERSAGIDQFLYREVELDVVWRLIDCAVAEARRGNAEAGDVRVLETIRAAVMDAHDLLGAGATASAAAGRLGEVLV